MTNTGVWNQEEADKGHLFSYRLAQWIGSKLNKYKPLYDFGCGKGAYCRYFEDIGFNYVVGIEGESLKDFEHHGILVLDLSKPLDFNKKGSVISIEVGEHIPAEFEQIFIKSVVDNTLPDHLSIISWAHEGQQGDGHVNCKPDWWVIENFEKHGFIFLPELTIEARSIPEGHVAYLKENLFVFKKA